MSMNKPYKPPSIRDGFDAWLDHPKRVKAHKGYKAADFRLWFENGATNTFIMQKTGIKTQNTLRGYRAQYEAEKEQKS